MDVQALLSNVGELSITTLTIVLQYLVIKSLIEALVTTYKLIVSLRGVSSDNNQHETS